MVGLVGRTSSGVRIFVAFVCCGVGTGFKPLEHIHAGFSPAIHGLRNFCKFRPNSAVQTESGSLLRTSLLGFTFVQIRERPYAFDGQRVSVFRQCTRVYAQLSQLFVVAASLLSTAGNQCQPSVGQPVQAGWKTDDDGNPVGSGRR